MKRLIGFALAVAPLAAATVLSGCGGGSDTSAGRAATSVLITDSPREDYAHIWATIYHVEIVPQSGSNVVLFDNPSGVQVDLRTLRDSTGQRFSFLGSASIPAGTYTAAQITIGPTMQLFKNGSAVGDPLPVDATLPRDASGHPILTDTFKTAKTITTTGVNTIIVDFNLARFVVRDSKVFPVVGEGDPDGVNDPGRHNGSEYVGTVSALTGSTPNLTFTLTYANAQTATVTTTASTTIYGSANLANGANVEVSGTLDAATGMLVATQVEVRPSQTARGSRAEGTAASLNATAGTFSLQLNTGCNFMPTSTLLSVATTSATVYYSDSGATLSQADFFTALAATPTVAVEGALDAAGTTLTATSLKIVNHTFDGGWEHDQHAFRPGVNQSNWGHGLFH